MADEQQESRAVEPVKVIGRYTIERIVDANGKHFTRRTCQGLTAYELLGVITQAQHEIVAQIGGHMAPPTVERKIIEGPIEQDTDDHQGEHKD